MLVFLIGKCDFESTTRCLNKPASGRVNLVRRRQKIISEFVQNCLVLNYFNVFCVFYRFLFRHESTTQKPFAANFVCIVRVTHTAFHVVRPVSEAFDVCSFVQVRMRVKIITRTFDNDSPVDDSHKLSSKSVLRKIPFSGYIYRLCRWKKCRFLY